MTPDPLDDLAGLLEEERMLILAGEWPALERLAPRKAACLAAASGDGAARLAPLAAALARNQALLAAALDGIREALRRRAALASSRARLVIYDASGARAEVSVAPSRVERKA